MRIHVLTTRSLTAHWFTYPVRTFTRHIADLGLRVRLFYHPGESLAACDVLCFVGDYFNRQLGANPSTMIDFISHYRSHVRGVVFFDVDDSTGPMRSGLDVLPHIELYAKNQLLEDRARYLHPFYGPCIYTDYYHHHHAIDEDGPATIIRQPAHPDHLSKLAVSWNLGLGDCTGTYQWRRWQETANTLSLTRVSCRTGNTGSKCGARPLSSPPLAGARSTPGGTWRVL
jgi:hypothetical protein